MGRRWGVLCSCDPPRSRGILELRLANKPKLGAPRLPPNRVRSPSRPATPRSHAHCSSPRRAAPRWLGRDAEAVRWTAWRCRLGTAAAGANSIERRYCSLRRHHLPGADPCTWAVRPETRRPVDRGVQSYTTRVLRDAGYWRRVWQPRYFDRLIRDEREFASVLGYVGRNPVEAGVGGESSDWPWLLMPPVCRIGGGTDGCWIGCGRFCGCDPPRSRGIAVHIPFRPRTPRNVRAGAEGRVSFKVAPLLRSFLKQTRFGVCAICCRPIRGLGALPRPRWFGGTKQGGGCRTGRSVRFGAFPATAVGRSYKAGLLGWPPG